MEPIIIYSTTWCPDCRYVKRFLADRGLQFQEVNIEGDDTAEEIVLRANGGKRKVPTLKVGDRYFSCSPFDAQRLAEQLDLPLHP